MNLYTSPNGHASVLQSRSGGFVVHVTATNYWGFISHNVRGDLEAAKRKADLLDKCRAREVGRPATGGYEGTRN